MRLAGYTLAIFLSCIVSPAADRGASLPLPPIALVQPQDGISRPEAAGIAAHVFRNALGCGLPGPVVNAGTHWEVGPPALVGGAPVLIHANSGAVSWGPSCSIQDFAALRRPDLFRQRCGPSEELDRILAGMRGYPLSPGLWICALDAEPAA